MWNECRYISVRTWLQYTDMEKSCLFTSDSKQTETTFVFCRRVPNVHAKCRYTKMDYVWKTERSNNPCDVLFKPDTMKIIQYISLIRMPDGFIHCLVSWARYKRIENKRTMTSRRQRAGQDRNTEKANRFSANVVKFKCLPTGVRNQNWVNEEVKNMLYLRFWQRWLSSGIWRSVILWTSRDVSEEYIAFIISRFIWFPIGIYGKHLCTSSFVKFGCLARLLSKLKN